MRKQLSGFLIAGIVAVAGGAGVAWAQVGVDDEAVAAQPEAAEAPPGPPPMPPPLVLHRRPDATESEALYVLHCGMCHGPNGMGTGLLSGNREVALLEARDNLPAQFVVTAARMGIGNMPAIPRGEVSDEEMQAIADYLAAGPHIDALGEPQ